MEGFFVVVANPQGKRLPDGDRTSSRSAVSQIANAIRTVTVAAAANSGYGHPVWRVFSKKSLPCPRRQDLNLKLSHNWELPGADNGSNMGSRRLEVPVLAVRNAVVFRR